LYLCKLYITQCNIYLTKSNLYVILISMKAPSRLKLKLARIENNLTQQALADIVNVTRQTIGLIEKGNYNPTLNLCIRIAKALDKTLDQLFWEDDKDE
jgi:putative transcriptional regulator